MRLTGLQAQKKRRNRLLKDLKQNIQYIRKSFEYKTNWIQDADRMQGDGLPNILRNCKRRGLKHRVRSFKRMLSNEAGTGQQVT